MNRNKIIELAKKIKALAEKGKGGERNAAKEKLERICEKYNISPDEISTSDESKDFVKQELELLVPDVTKFTTLNKKGNRDERNGDMYDAIVAGLYKN